MAALSKLRSSLLQCRPLAKTAPQAWAAFSSSAGDAPAEKQSQQAQPTASPGTHLHPTPMLFQRVQKNTRQPRPPRKPNLHSRDRLQNIGVHSSRHGSQRASLTLLRVLCTVDARTGGESRSAAASGGPAPPQQQPRGDHMLPPRGRGREVGATRLADSIGNPLSCLSHDLYDIMFSPMYHLAFRTLIARRRSHHKAVVY